MTNQATDNAALREGDLVPDHALTADDRDDFGHSEIAARVADLLTTADPPLNVALFGPWGSGKSSFAALLRAALKARKMKTAFVHYDAWKYSGEALQRSFIAEAAGQLGVDDPYYTSQLAQTIERTQIDLKQVTWKQARALLRWVSRLVLPVMFGALILLALIIAGVAVVAGQSARHELLRFVALSAIPVGLAVVSAVAKLIADAVSTRAIEAPPSEERFEERFKELLETATKEGGYERFVFFIDELDRVSRKDVVTTLGVIRNFLDQKNAVFVVAADKQVLEQAFAALPQATPTNEDAPYYSSASEFLDKIFQHQVALPPLRGQSLFRFAYDLVAERTGGLWEELKTAEPDAVLLNGVLYALIPSHVRSPRRVKVLLNNFATNTRVAQSRGIDWLLRARELAKLTVLQTEFPLLAADLPAEPRLPRFVLSTEGAVISDRTRRLLERHDIATPEASLEDEESDDEDDGQDETGVATPEDATPAEEVGATDTLLVPRAQQRKLIGVQRENLRRYLIRVQDIPDPTGELLYLQAGGVAEGLDDPTLGDLLESEARDDPATVVAAVRERDKDEQQAALRVLAGMAEQAYAGERANIITALLGVVSVLDGDVGPSLRPAADALSAYVRTDALEAGQLIGALRLGVALAEAGGDHALRDSVLADVRLLATASRVWSVGTMIDSLPEAEQERVQEAIAKFLPETTDVLTEPLLVVSAAAAERLLRHPRIKAAAQALLDDSVLGEEEAEKLARFWLQVLDDRAEPAPVARLRLIRLLLDADSAEAYAVALEAAPDAREAISASPAANGVGLAALRTAKPADWDTWLPWLDEKADAASQHTEMAQSALTGLLSELPEANEDELNVALDLVSRVARVGRLQDEDVGAPLTSAVQEALQLGAWWTSEEHLFLHEKIHEVIKALGEAIGDAATEQFSGLRYQDVNRGLATAGATPLTCRGVRDLAVEFDAASLNALATRLASTPLTGVADLDVELVGARTHLAREAELLGEDTEAAPYGVPASQVVAAGRHDTGPAHEVVAAWLGTDPPTLAVEELAEGLERSPRDREAEAFARWLDRLPSDDDRTQVLLDLLTRASCGWLAAPGAAGVRGYSEQVIGHAIADAAMREPRAEERQRVVEAFAALAPKTAAGQGEVANMIIWLLGRNRKSDFEIALELVPALGDEHGMGQKVGRAFRSSADALGRKIPAKHRAAFEAAKIVLGKDYFARPPKKGLSRLIGR
jgi:hypothetical protein